MQGADRAWVCAELDKMLSGAAEGSAAERQAEALAIEATRRGLLQARQRRQICPVACLRPAVMPAMCRAAIARDCVAQLLPSPTPAALYSSGSAAAADFCACCLQTSHDCFPPRPSPLN